MLRASSAAVSLDFVALLLSAAALPLSACDTPVYEYALQHWDRDDYAIYYLHDGSESPLDTSVNQLLRNVADAREGHANLQFVSLDASLAPDRLPPDSRRVLRANAEVSRPRHIMLSPKGRTLFSGRMTLRDLRDLLGSPKTAALAEMLSEGARGVLVVLTDTEESLNVSALETARAVIESAEADDIPVGLLDVSRQDEKERWLVRQLLAVEADLKDIPGPLVFGAYGRCHITEAYLGKGINSANLTDLVAFMNGPCTCEIKAANMGVDIITKWNWDAYLTGSAAPPRQMEPGGYVTLEDE